MLGELGVEAHTAGGLLAAGTWPCPRGPGHRPYPRPSRPARPHVCSVPSFLLRVQGHQGWRGSRGAGNPAALRGAVSAVRLQQWLRTMRRKPFLGLASHQLHFLSLICSPQMAPPPPTPSPLAVRVTGTAWAGRCAPGRYGARCLPDRCARLQGPESGPGGHALLLLTWSWGQCHARPGGCLRGARLLSPSGASESEVCVQRHSLPPCVLSFPTQQTSLGLDRRVF